MKKLVLGLLALIGLFIAGYFVLGQMGLSSTSNSGSMFTEENYITEDMYNTEEISLSTDKVVDDEREAVGMIILRGTDDAILARGTAFLIDKSGIIVTNAHCVEDNEAVSAEFLMANGTLLSVANVLNFSNSFDLAILKLNYQGEDLPYLTLEDSQTAAVNDTIRMIGTPSGDEERLNTVFEGTISKELFRNKYGFHDIQTNISSASGVSGGPIINDSGKVIAVNRASYSDDSDIRIGVPSEYINILMLACNTDDISIQKLNSDLVFRHSANSKGEIITSDDDFKSRQGYMYSSDNERKNVFSATEYLSDEETSYIRRFNCFQYDNSSSAYIHYSDYNRNSVDVVFDRMQRENYQWMTYGVTNFNENYESMLDGLAVKYTMKDEEDSSYKNLYVASYKENNFAPGILNYHYDFEDSDSWFYSKNEEGEIDGEAVLINDENILIYSFKNGEINGEYYKISEGKDENLVLSVFEYADGEVVGDGYYGTFGENNSLYNSSDATLESNQEWRIGKSEGLLVDIVKTTEGTYDISVGDIDCQLASDFSPTNVSKEEDGKRISAEITPAKIISNYSDNDYDYFETSYDIDSGNVVGTKSGEEQTITLDNKNIQISSSESHNVYYYDDKDLYIGEFDPSQKTRSGRGTLFSRGYMMYLGNWNEDKISQIYLNELKQGQNLSGLGEYITN